jgi:hypothetical protein
MRVVKQLESDQEVWVDEYSGVRYAPIQDEPSVDPVALLSRQAIEIADSIRYIIDTLHDDKEAANSLIEYVLQPVFDEVHGS